MEKTLTMLSLLVFVVASSGVWSSTLADDNVPSHNVASFLTERATWQPMCLYTFDGLAIGGGRTIQNQVPGDECPFDALQPDKELVTTLNAASTFWQLGVHLAEDPNNDTKHVQLSSISSVSARDFFTMAAVNDNSVSGAGVTFEMVIRRRRKSNRSMTLFSIANEYNNCVDPGFRLDVNEHQVLAFIYFLPVLEEGGEAGVEACYEQRLFSVDNSAVCKLPPVLDPVESTPPVQIIVTLDPSSERGLWKTDFYMSYTDTETMQRVNCAVHDKQHPPNSKLLYKLIEGRYRLYLGNSPRNVSSPRERKHLAKARSIQLLGNTSSLNSTERLRVMLKQKLASITGPRLPKAIRIFGDNSLSLHILGITFPPLSEDTPLAYLRSKMADFKEQYGDQIVDYLVNLVQQKSKSSVVVKRSEKSSSQHSHLLPQIGQSSTEGDEFSRTALFQGANGATFDLFHFAIYQRVVPEEQVDLIARQWLLPSCRFPSLQQTVRVPEDSLALLNLTMLNGVFNDTILELRGLPEFGQLLLFPDKTVVTPENKDAFRKLAAEYQSKIFFRSEPDQNNENLPLPNSVAFSRRLKPYATITFGIADSLSTRGVNKSEEAKIDIYVDPVNDAPRPRTFELEVPVAIDVPNHLSLGGDDIDGAPVAVAPHVETSDAADLLSSFTFTNTTDVTISRQWLRIVEMPRFGKLFECNSSCGVLEFDINNGFESLEPTRIYRNSVDTTNATRSTNLVYVYRGWGQHRESQGRNASLVVDELRYQLSDGDPGVFSDTAVVKFVLVNDMNGTRSDIVLTSIRLEEDSCEMVSLGAIDPLAAFFNYRTRLKITIFPQHGELYQFNPSSTEGSEANLTNLSFAFIGSHITATNAIVSDSLGRVVFVPKLDYFNLESSAVLEASDIDFFEYQVLNFTQLSNESFVVNENSSTAHFSDGSVARRVLLEVVNVPDGLIVLPPLTFTANESSSGEAVQTPVAFEDPDSSDPSKLYQVNLEAADSTSEFKFGFAITDDDIMTDCPLERPCVLNRTTNGTRCSANSTSSELQFYISTQLYDPSHIQVTGTKTALSTALSALTLSVFSPSIERKSEFTLWVKRIGPGHESDADSLQTEATLTIIFPTDDQPDSSSSGDLFSAVSTQLERYISTFLVLIASWLVLSNSSWFSTGFCCCCCCKARKKRRDKFEREQQLFQSQVAQNDDEYSVLLLSLADILLEPNLLASVALLESCVTTAIHQRKTELLTQGFILRSLLPLLESERQGTRFVFQLMAVEYSELAATRGSDPFFLHNAFLSQASTVSKVLASFCRLVGSKWVSSVLTSSGDIRNLYLGETGWELDKLLDNVATHVEALPAEIVILSRACIKLFQTTHKDALRRELEMDAIHLVVFNHFLGPALIFPQNCVPDFSPSLKQQNVLNEMAYHIVGFSNHWSSLGGSFRARSSSNDSLLGTLNYGDVAVCQRKYEKVLETISQSSSIASSYDPSNLQADVDSELMGWCLMNIHSLLDSNFPEFRRRLGAQTSISADQIETTVTRTTRLLKALDWPLSSIHELVEYAAPELLSDPLLWTDFSCEEWEARAALNRQNQHKPTVSQHESLLTEFSSDLILEQDTNSPTQVDWLTP